MKKIADLLQNIKEQPEFKKLSVYELTKQVVDSLPERLKKGVKYSYLKNSSIVFVLLHPLYKKEFIFSKDKISSIIKEIPFEIEITGMSFVIINESVCSQKDKNFSENDLLFKERSLALFVNNLKNQKLFKILENIRETISLNKTNT